MALKISKGKQYSPTRAVIYGTEAIGKTTLASQFPTPLILDTEEGSRRIDCDRAEIHNWVELEGAVLELARDQQGYKTIVIDSADWAERMLVEHLLNQSHKKSIEDFGFGKGYVMLMERIGKFLDNCDSLVRAGLHVVFVAHSKVQRTSPPDMPDGFDRYELKLTKQVSPLFKEWCDLLLFCNYKTKLVEGNDGRKKATGGKQRVMYAERSAAWDAKNRYGLPEEMPMSIDSLAVVFGDCEAAPLKVAEDAAAVMTKASKAIAAAKTAKELERLTAGVVKREADGALTHDQAGVLHDQIEMRERAIEEDSHAVA